MDWRLGLCAIAVAATLAACIVHQPARIPSVQAPPAWQAGKAAGAQPIDTVSAYWWRNFHDPELDRLVDEALANNFDSRIAMDRIRIAADVVRATRSQEFPSLSVNGTPTDPLIAQTSTFSTSTRPDVDSNLFVLSLDASYEIDLWDRVESATDAARSDYAASVFDMGAAQLALIGAVARSYFAVRQLDENVASAGEAVALYRRQLEITQLRLAAGRVDASSETDAMTALSAAQAQLDERLRERAQAQQQLALLLGRNPEDLKIVERGLRSTPTPAPPEGLPSQLLTRRPDLRATLARLQAEDERIGVARAELFPQVALTGKFGFVVAFAHNLSKIGSTVLGIGPVVDYSIFDAGRRRAEFNASETRYDIALLEYRKAVAAAFADTEKALLDYQAAVEADERDTALIDRREHDLARTQASADEGRGSRAEVIGAQLKLLDLRQAELSDYRERLDSIVRLFEALGGDWTAAPSGGMPNSSPEAGAASTEVCSGCPS